jgi:hypothetical protein
VLPPQVSEKPTIISLGSVVEPFVVAVHTFPVVLLPTLSVPVPVEPRS